MFRVSDLKQWFYCPRVLYWTHLMPVDRNVTAKMEFARQSHQAVSLLEERRTLRRYRLQEATRHFHVSLSSLALGLTGKLDLLLATPEELVPVEFKDTLGEIRLNHRLQLAAYALLADEHYGGVVKRGFWVCVPRGTVRQVTLDASLKARVRAALQEMRRVVEEEIMPAPADLPAKCRDCEFRRFCGDRD